MFVICRNNSVGKPQNCRGTYCWTKYVVCNYVILYIYTLYITVYQRVWRKILHEPVLGSPMPWLRFKGGKRLPSPATDQCKHLDGLISIVRTGGRNWNLGLDDTSTNSKNSSTNAPTFQTITTQIIFLLCIWKFQDLYLNYTTCYNTWHLLHQSVCTSSLAT